MPRIRKGAARHQAKKRILKRVKGHRDPAGHLYRRATEAAVRAAVNARRGIRYNQFIDGCKKADIQLNRKVLSEIAIADPEGFDVIVAAARAAIA